MLLRTLLETRMGADIGFKHASEKEISKMSEDDFKAYMAEYKVYVNKHNARARKKAHKKNAS